MAAIPQPLASGPLCPACGGTGADAAATAKLRPWEGSHVHCRACQGNGLDPAELFRWGPHPALATAPKE
jgi:hypothetical protein